MSDCSQDIAQAIQLLVSIISDHQRRGEENSKQQKCICRSPPRVKKFDFSIQEIAGLFLVNNFVNYFLSPFIGRCIVKYGERKVLSLEYMSLIFIFIGYAVVEDKYIAALLYIFDHIFYNFAIAIRTFFQKIADPADIAPSMAVGFTINHIAAVVLPVLGGLLWMIDYRIPFLAGSVLSFLSFISVQSITAQLAENGQKE